MSDQFVAEIRIFPFNFPPTGWAFCDGQLLPISQNTALFSLLGTTYGGNGKSNFALPNLQGKAPMHTGYGDYHFLGEDLGTQTVTLLESEIPYHSHNLQANRYPGDYPQPAPDASLSQVPGDKPYSSQTSPAVNMAWQSLAPSGGGLPHNNMMPYLTLNFCIAMQGIFPPRP